MQLLTLDRAAELHPRVQLILDGEPIVAVAPVLNEVAQEMVIRPRRPLGRERHGRPDGLVNPPVEIRDVAPPEVDAEALHRASRGGLWAATFRNGPGAASDPTPKISDDRSRSLRFNASPLCVTTAAGSSHR